jgi:hypothetical protein
VQDLIAKRVGRERNTSEGPTRKVRGVIHCRRYSRKGYNSYTYKVEIDNTKDSDKSEE